MRHELNEQTAEHADRWLDGHNHERLERMTGISRTQIYDWQSGRYPLPVYAVAPLFEAVPDVAALERVLGLRGLGLQLSRVPTATAPNDVRDAALRVAGEAGDVARLVADVYRDGKLTNDERRKLELAAEQVQRVAEELRQAARSVPSTGAPRPCKSVERKTSEQASLKVAGGR